MQPNRQTCLKNRKMPPPLRHMKQHTRYHAGPIYNTRAGHGSPNQNTTFPTNKDAARDEVNWLTMGSKRTILQEQASFCTVHTPYSLMKYAKIPIKYEHYAFPMVHPITGQTISSYKKNLHNPATANFCQGELDYL
jgi:hypothetical protein